MNPKTKILIGVLGVAVIVGGVWLVWRNQSVKVVTDKQEYGIGESLKMKIMNNLLASICFSSCYPYYLEHGNGGWDSYSYQDCQDLDVARDCIGRGGVKAFETILPKTKKGPHRLVIPVCEECSAGERFERTSILYSDTFEVK